MTTYLEILSVARPADIGRDDNARQLFSVNFEATAYAPVGNWPREVHALLKAAGLATDANTRIGRDTDVPQGDGPYLNIVDTGGVDPLETHDDNKYERLSCQVVVRAASYATAETRATAIWRELDAKRGVAVTI